MSVKHWSDCVDRRLWFFLVLVSLMSIIHILGYNLSHERGLMMNIGVVCYAMTKALLLSWALVISSRWRWLNYILWGIVGLYSVISVTNFVSYSLYGYGMSRKLLLTLFETNLNELRQFFPPFLSNVATWLVSWHLWLPLVLIVVMYLLIRKLPNVLFNIISIVPAVAGLVYFLTYGMFYTFGRTDHVIMMKTVTSLNETINDYSMVREYTSRSRDLQYPESLTSDYRASNIIYVIGESATREHMSAYGYKLPTTPWLESYGDTVKIFDNAVAPSTLTTECLPHLLSYLPESEDSGKWYEYPTIFKLMKELGYRVSWISNQEQIGMLTGVLTGLMSTDVDETHYVGLIDSDDLINDKYDEVVLKPLENELKDSEEYKFIGIHLMGSHVNYVERYPASRAVFSPSDVLEANVSRPTIDRDRARYIAYYDNSIYYTDSVMNEIIQRIAAVDEPSVMFYVSDHGENVYDRGDYMGRDKECVKVPFVVYANEAYRRANPYMMDMIEQARHRQFSTSGTVNSILLVGGIGYELYDPAHDFLSPEYAYPTIYVDTDEYKRTKDN